MSTQKPAATPAELIASAKDELAQGGDYTRVIAQALVAIAEQGQPVEHVIDVDEHSRQRTIYTVANISNGATMSIHATQESADAYAAAQPGFEVLPWLVLS